MLFPLSSPALANHSLSPSPLGGAGRDWLSGVWSTTVPGRRGGLSGRLPSSSSAAPRLLGSGSALASGRPGPSRSAPSESRLLEPLRLTLCSPEKPKRVISGLYSLLEAVTFFFFLVKTLHPSSLSFHAGCLWRSERVPDPLGFLALGLSPAGCNPSMPSFPRRKAGERLAGSQGTSRGGASGVRHTHSRIHNTQADTHTHTCTCEAAHFQGRGRGWRWGRVPYGAPGLTPTASSISRILGETQKVYL